MSQPWVKLSFLALVSIGAVACSHQWRESNPEVSATDLQGIIDEALTSENIDASGVEAQSQANTFYQDHNATTVYFNDGPRKGHRMSVALSHGQSMSTLSFLLPAAALRNGPVLAARVLFFEHAINHQAILIVGIIQNSTLSATTLDEHSGFTYYAFQGTTEIKNGEYTMTIAQGADGSPVTLRSHDVKGGSLRATIQLAVYTHGQSQPVAKFTSLAGYR